MADDEEKKPGDSEPASSAPRPLIDLIPPSSRPDEALITPKPLPLSSTPPAPDSQPGSRRPASIPLPFDLAPPSGTGPRIAEKQDSELPPSSDRPPESSPVRSTRTPALEMPTAPEVRNALLAPAPPHSVRDPFPKEPAPRSSRPPRSSRVPFLDSGPPSGRNRVVAASIPPAPASLRPSMMPRLPGVEVGASESTKGSVGMVSGTASALKRMESMEVVRQMNEIGLKSLGFVCLVLGFVGAILVYQAGLQALRIVPDTTNVGSSYLELLVRDLAASITGLMLATRVGAAIAAEIGSMKVTDQLDALRLCQTDPVDYLVAPRVVACFVATPVLTIFGGAVAVLTGAATGYLAFGINPTIFLDLRYVDPGDLITGVVKSFAFGLSIPLVSAHAGLYTSGGSEGVGNATTKAVVGASLAVIILGFFIGAIGQVLFS